jgi:hypothetical protein
MSSEWTEALSIDRRRQATTTRKLLIIAEMTDPGVTASMFARRHGVGYRKVIPPDNPASLLVALPSELVVGYSE